jgi:hypothetical protein
VLFEPYASPLSRPNAPPPSSSPVLLRSTKRPRAHAHLSPRVTLSLAALFACSHTRGNAATEPHPRAPPPRSSPAGLRRPFGRAAVPIALTASH